MKHERYQHRERTLYALIFPARTCYVGQTIDPRRREQQHRHAWAEPFDFRVLGTMLGTEAEAEEFEYAWRFVAHRHRFRVLARTRAGETFVVRPRGRMNSARYRLASTLRWPADLQPGIFARLRALIFG